MFVIYREDPPKSPDQRGTFQAPPFFPPIGGDQGGEGAGGDPALELVLILKFWQETGFLRCNLFQFYYPTFF